MDPSLVRLDDDTLVLGYTGEGFDGYSTAISISGTTLSFDDTKQFEFDVKQGRRVAMTALDADTVLVAYRGPSADGWIKALDVDSSNVITQSGALEHDPDGNASYHSIVRVDDSTVALAYTD